MTHAELWERHKAVMPDWLALYYEEPIEIVEGTGRRVTDGEGATYLDFFAGILTNAIGYDIAEISDAVREQLGSGIAHTSTLYLIRKQIELAERIAELSGIPNAKVFFTNSGTEANETALLLATQNRRSNQVLALRNSYHGRAFADDGDHRQPRLVRAQPVPGERAVRAGARTGTAARSATCPTRTTSPPASRPAQRHRDRPPPATSPV